MDIYVCKNSMYFSMDFSIFDLLFYVFHELSKMNEDIYILIYTVTFYFVLFLTQQYTMQIIIFFYFLRNTSMGT